MVVVVRKASLMFKGPQEGGAAECSWLLIDCLLLESQGSWNRLAEATWEKSLSSLFGTW